jgi:hypothetical protein
MSKHIGRKQRWTRESPSRYSSCLGTVVYQQKAWYALLEYHTLAPPQGPGGCASWVAHAARLGPFKRPRNAMVALEQEATILKNRHGSAVRINGELWAGT